ncbi:MAG: aminoacetone oxidase family FAD-binding enzyme [Myxococcota bacterium]|nr:aminoacetone oxidase family FAD-binding enzyme [Myxococcota bacterium]
MSEQEPQTEICIVGAGAAGLWAAAECARRGASVLVLEKTRRTGTKVLSSGGTRCNLTTTLDARDTARAFGQGHDFIRPALQALSPQMVRAHFERIGVKTKTEADFDKVFPASDSALQVRNALERHARQAGAQFLLSQPVTSLEPTAAGWTVHCGNRRVHCRRLILATGGKSYPKTGTTGDGWVWLRALGLHVVDPVPALVPLESPAPWVHALSGIAIDGELRVGKLRRRRPVLFTHKGLSGPGAMDLSEPFARRLADEARLDLLPELPMETLRAQLIDGASAPGSPRLRTLLPLPKRVLATLAQQSGLPDDNPQLNQISRKARNRLVENVKGWRIPISGTLGFSKAEVSAGGLGLDQLDRRSMQVHAHPGLFVVGELLDLTGPIGGFNFQAAFATAQLASVAATQS